MIAAASPATVARRRMLPWARASARLHAALQIALLAALAYIPALAAAPGRMPTDTKLYLYLDPTRLTGDAPFAWDSRQFAGWVPHQTVSYLWPSGPWYSLFSGLGVPDWIAQRLWVATLLFAGGLGARWLGRQLGLAAAGALVAALCYQLSPYVLPYISRTSAMLLPWAGLGWLIGLTIRAATRSSWRHVAIFGLVMATVAAPNATAILMIAPAPALWLAHAAFSRVISWRRAAITAAKIGGASVAVSLWWIAMLSVQGRYGADVLGYSESLQAVSFTASSAEVLRGMGYWLFYVRDPIGFATSASFDYMSSGRLLAVGFGLLLAGLAGLAWTKWASRRYAVLLVFVGVVLAVGVHPIDDASPLMAPFAENSRSSIALALRSSTRALPLSTLGLALGAGALVTALRPGLLDGARRRRQLPHAARRAAPWIVGGLAIANMPALFDGGFADPNLLRDENPPLAWTDAVAALDAGSSDYRVFQLPGTEFGAYRWGYTVDPPLPGLTDKPLVTRDLLPLGSPAAMDLVYALDDRFQEGTAELASVAPIARLLGVDTLWLPNDVAFDRFRTPRPELTAATFAEGDPGLGPAVTYGTPQVNVPAIAMIDEQSISEASVGQPLPAVALVPIEDPEPVVRATAAAPTVVAGSADGLVDAAAAGLVSGHELIRYSADLVAAGDDASAIGASPHVVITDSNRDRAHQWRTAQDVWGFTEDGSDGSGVLEFDSADQRTPVFPDQTSEDMTVAQQRGPVQIAASAYGEPFAYRPESRAAMAIDGDLDTAWVVADRFQPVGEYVLLRTTEAVSQLRLVQPQDGRNRWITEVEVRYGSTRQRVALTEASRTAAGQMVALPGTASEVTIAITATGNGPLAPGEGLDAVGFAEIDAGLGPTEEVVRVPSNVLAQTNDDQQVDLVLSRLRTRPTNRWRDDPEPVLARAFTLPRPRSFEPAVTARLDRRASEAVIAALLGWTGTTANRHLTGVPAMGGWAATDGDPGTSWVTPIGDALGSILTIPINVGPVNAGPLAAGTTTLSDLRLHQPMSPQLALITEVEVRAGDAARRVAVGPPDASGVSVVSFDPLDITDAASIDVEITATNGATTIDRRYADTVTLAAGISEVEATGITATPLPSAADLPCRDDLLSIDGEPVAVRLSGTVAGLFAGEPASVERCDGEPVALDAGEHIVRSAPGRQTGIDIDRVVLSGRPDTPAEVEAPAPDVTVVDFGHTSRTVRVGPCPAGCWLVFGEGFNKGWQAEAGGHSLGEPAQVDGGFNGWYLPPSQQATTVHLSFAGQRTLTIGLVLSALGVLACVALAVIDRRRRDGYEPAPPLLVSPAGEATTGERWSWRGEAFVVTAVATIAGFLVIAPSWAFICGAIAFVGSFVLRRPRLTAGAAIACAAWIGAVMVRTVATEHPFANAGFPAEFEHLHRLGLAVVVLLLAASFTGLRRPR